MWKNVKLGEIFNFKNGRSFKKTEWKENGLPIIRIQNLNNPNSSFNFFEGDYDSSIEVNSGDLLFSWSGTVGTSFGAHIWERDKGVLNQHIFKLTKKREIDTRYGFYCLKHITKLIEQSVVGAVGIRHVTKKNLVEFEIPLPPLPVQKQIVEKLDAAFADIDKAISATEKNIENVEALFSKTLNKTLDDNLSKEFLLGELCEVITKGTTPTSVGHKFTDEGINFIKIESITNQGNFLPEKMAHIDEECHESLKRSQLAPGDILFSIAGALGRTAIVTDDIVPANTNQALAIIRLKKHLNINKDYLRYVLNSNLTINQSDSLKAGVAQQNLSLSQLKTYKINIPSAPIQNDIVKKIDLIKEQTNALIECYQNKFIQYESLKSSILNQAFSGELTKGAA